MPSSEIRHFADPSEYVAAFRTGQHELVVTERGSFAATLTRIDLHRLWMQRFSESLPRIVHAADVSGRAFISFCTQPGPSLYLNGVDMQSVGLVRHSDGDSSFQRSSGGVSLACMSLPIEDMVAAGAAIAGCDLTPPRDTLVVQAPRSALAKLQRLHAAAGHLAEHAPEVLANPGAADGLEKELVHAMVACLKPPEAHQDRSGVRRQEAIMRRFRAFLEVNADKPLQIPDICAAIRVAESTLRICCREFLGVGPLKYLWLRRMEQARQALTSGAPAVRSVTEIATTYGFWELGRFAVAYRELFGESPSTTLSRLP
jgi:AraC-like DNA-binding protein